MSEKLQEPLNHKKDPLSIVPPQLKPLQDSIAALFERLEDIADGLDGIYPAMETMRLYYERKGVEEGLFGPEDLNKLSELQEEEDESDKD